MPTKKTKLVLFASGNGSNAENIVRYFRKQETAEVALILTNNPKAFVIQRAASLGVDCKVITRDDFKQAGSLITDLRKKQIDFIVLAGFLWLIPEALIKAFPNKILNIHPALLPKYGGKGMYGNFVHQAVSDARETQTGISIHYVNAAYDEGDILFQKTVTIKAGEDPEHIAEKVHKLEYDYYPKVIENLLTKA